MLKGKTEIQLTDVDTGYTQHYYDENMVTNALSDIFTLNTATSTGFLMGADSDTSGFGGSLYSTALGGILLFDSTLEEDASNYFAPAGVHMVGCGVMNNDTASADTARGVYNTSESSRDLDNKTVKFVYDFPTTQANGTIKSVCLTSNCGGYASYGADGIDTTQTSMSIGLCKTSCTRYVTSTNYGEYPVLWDYDNDICYTAQVTVPSTGKLTLTMRKRCAHFHSISVIGVNNTYGEILSSNAIVLSGYYGYTHNTYSNDTYSPNLFYDEVAGRFYFIFNASYSYTFSSGGSISICTISTDDFSYTTSTITNSTGNSLYTYAPLAIYNGYIYWISTARTSLYKISVEDGSTAAEITGVSFYSNFLSASCVVKAGRIYAFDVKAYSSYYPYYNIIDTESEDVRFSGLLNNISNQGRYQGYFKTAPVLGKPWLYWSGMNYSSAYCAGYFQVLQNYLATINNLSTAVTKTSSQTMKITYTISES